MDNFATVISLIFYLMVIGIFAYSLVLIHLPSFSSLGRNVILPQKINFVEKFLILQKTKKFLQHKKEKNLYILKNSNLLISYNYELYEMDVINYRNKKQYFKIYWTNYRTYSLSTYSDDEVRNIFEKLFLYICYDFNKNSTYSKIHDYINGHLYTSFENKPILSDLFGKYIARQRHHGSTYYISTQKNEASQKVKKYLSHFEAEKKYILKNKNVCLTYDYDSHEINVENLKNNEQCFKSFWSKRGFPTEIDILEPYSKCTDEQKEEIFEGLFFCICNYFNRNTDYNKILDYIKQCDYKIFVNGIDIEQEISPLKFLDIKTEMNYENKWKLVDINFSNEEELASLEGIDINLAKSIVEYRDQNGKFKNKNEFYEQFNIPVYFRKKMRHFITLSKNRKETPPKPKKTKNLNIPEIPKTTEIPAIPKSINENKPTPPKNNQNNERLIDL